MLKNNTWSVLLVALALPSASFADEIIRVLELKGNVTAGSQTLKVGSEIKAGDPIHVDANSQVMVSLGKDVVTKLGPQSDAKIKVRNQKDWELALERGVTAAAIRNPNKRPNHYQIRTRAATMGVRGTVFYVENFEKSPLFLCTCKGTVAVENTFGKSVDTITATHHDHPVTLDFKNGFKEWSEKSAPMGSSHSDADVEYLEKTLAQLK